MSHEQLIEEAMKAMENAYAPYSNYHVGACLLCRDGRTFYGANIENASYGATNCGERSAVFAAYSYGYRKDDIEALAIVSDGEKLGTPCGICRQVLSELLNPDTPIILSNGRDSMVRTIAQLLPESFGADDLVQ